MFQQINLNNFDGVVLNKNNLFRDNRGDITKIFYNFSEIFDSKSYNLVVSNPKKGTLRGLHFRKEQDESKAICCTKGSIFDVIIDLRPNSENYLNWSNIVLSESNELELFIPSGFAHGYQTLENDTVILYKLSLINNIKDNKTINYKDGRFKIPWPLEVTIVSEKDENQTIELDFYDEN